MNKSTLSAKNKKTVTNESQVSLHSTAKILELLLALESKELNHLAAILHVYVGGLNFMK